MSDLVDYVYLNWCKIARENIVKYLPGITESLFDKNSEECLSGQYCFNGSHYLQLPIFMTADCTFRKSDDIYCFAQEEYVVEPEKVHNLMGYRRALFCPPSSVPISKYGIDIVKNVYIQLVRRALEKESITAEVLDYLDSVKYEYSESHISSQEILKLTAGQIETIMLHKKLAYVIREIGCNCVRNNSRFKFLVTGVPLQSLSEVMYDGFDIAETPKQIEKYFTYCKEKCVCLDIGEGEFLPLHNAVILSKQNPIMSLEAFCSTIDRRDTFTVRLKMRELSRQLDDFTQDGAGTAEDYLRELKKRRQLLKEALGKGYKSYLNLIANSGADSGRFILELLQNADDCSYPENTTPAFQLKQEEFGFMTGCNETGFTRENIRSITAIGESTKSKLLTGETGATGEKGIGFKTVFSIAAKVQIISGEFSFELTADEPTIPKYSKLTSGHIPGTVMKFFLKGHASIPAYSTKQVLEFCLCLKRLKKIIIGKHTVTIDDDGTQRIVTIDRIRYVFRKYIHTFIVEDEKALGERIDETNKETLQQSITCYIPENSKLAAYLLYNGLPTKHKIHIPMVIDAPFILTTSREEINIGFAAWNGIICKEMYAAIRNVIGLRIREERASVLRFTRFMWRLYGNAGAYVYEVFDSEYLNSYPFLDELKKSSILPTFNPDVFCAPAEKTALRYPEAAVALFRLLPQSDYDNIDPSAVIDVSNEEYDTALKALGCEEVGFLKVYPVMTKYAGSYIHIDEFRNTLYKYLLLNILDGHREKLRQLAIIPVFGSTHGETLYIAWKSDSIFVKGGSSISGNDFYLLNEKLLSKSDCERILDVNINEMNAEWERNRYNKQLKTILSESSISDAYEYLLDEYNDGRFDRNDSFDTLFALKEKIPLKNQLGEITSSELYISEWPMGYFTNLMIQQIAVHDECKDFAKYIQCSELREIHYEDINYYEELTDDDVEALNEEFLNYEEILRGFYRDGYLSVQLLNDYQLEYLTLGRINEYETDEEYEFPEVPVVNHEQLKAYVKKLWENPIKVVSVTEERTVHKGRKNNGDFFNLDINDARDGVLRLYAPEGKHRICHCQRCHKVRAQDLIEVDNIELLPKYFFPQLRVALCLECSVWFKKYRNTDGIRNNYIETIKNADISDQGKIDITIKDGFTLTFTAKHLAEIQEILRRMPD